MGGTDLSSSGAIRDVGPRKMPVANGSAGGSFESLFTSSRVDAVILQGWGEQGATREHGQHGTPHGREWLSG